MECSSKSTPPQTIPCSGGHSFQRASPDCGCRALRLCDLAALRVEISDRLAFGAQRTNVLVRDDLAGQAVDLVTLRRRPATKALHAFEKAEPKDLGILAHAFELDRILACRHHVAGCKLGRLARTVPEFRWGANHAINHDPALCEGGRVRRRRRALRQQRVAARI